MPSRAEYRSVLRLLQKRSFPYRKFPSETFRAPLERHFLSYTEPFGWDLGLREGSETIAESAGISLQREYTFERR